MTSEERAQLGRAWIEMGLAEHASVGAFSRFVLHLLSLGSPPDLLLGAIRAMEDEVHHARFCFNIARQFTDVAVAPGKMDISDIFEQRDDPDSILSGAILEGCFEETISARFAEVALERVEDPNIRAALVRIVADESKHADLSWRFVSWMLQKYPELRPRAEACFAQALARPIVDSENDDWPILERYGLLMPSSRREVRQITLRDVIIPRIESLLGYCPKTGRDSIEETLAQHIK